MPQQLATVKRQTKKRTRKLWRKSANQASLGKNKCRCEKRCQKKWTNFLFLLFFRESQCEFESYKTNRNYINSNRAQSTYFIANEFEFPIQFRESRPKKKKLIKLCWVYAKRLSITLKMPFRDALRTRCASVKTFYFNRISASWQFAKRIQCVINVLGCAIHSKLFAYFLTSSWAHLPIGTSCLFRDHAYYDFYVFSRVCENGMGECVVYVCVWVCVSIKLSASPHTRTQQIRLTVRMR